MYQACIAAVLLFCPVSTLGAMWCHCPEACAWTSEMYGCHEVHVLHCNEGEDDDEGASMTMHWHPEKAKEKEESPENLVA